jgi:hypothetical protein
MIAPQGNFSADVQLRLHAHGEVYELGQLGPEFAMLRQPQSISGTEAEIETIIDGETTRWPIRITTPPTTESRRFSFEGVG